MIDALQPGAELDHAVAKACGWRTVNVLGSDGKEACGTVRRIDGELERRVFRPSTDLNDAFAAAEICGLVDRASFQKINDEWRVIEKVDSDPPGYYGKQELVRFAGTGDALSLAICAAILKLKGAK